MKQLPLFYGFHNALCAMGFWVVFGFMTTSAHAQEQPRGLVMDNRIKVVPYEENNVVPVQASPFTTTQIVSRITERPNALTCRI